MWGEEKFSPPVTSPYISPLSSANYIDAHQKLYSLKTISSIHEDEPKPRPPLHN
jgi:hypothetical protein